MQTFKKYTNRFLILIVSLQLINLSVHAHPSNEIMLANSFHDYNRIDNAVEYVLEVVLRKKDAIPEDHHSNQDHSFHAKYVDFKLVIPQYHCIEPGTFTVKEANQHFPRYVFYKYGFSTEINPPPPKGTAV